ncbi:glycosyltransferase [Gynuella sunshinyii]|uniref:Putative glycosyltransferase n=1 Tax=Gynuella sunshinyii YC6258 TaxID=1445510 RepID=A0A0C5VRE2_9GAMM|nr:glycosyltransferase family A protein [Gynuella sunshinyii]AJQ92809.1 putative glycosyltransferase [Gynuella sunshinyii YC6258]
MTAFDTEQSDSADAVEIISQDCGAVVIGRNEGDRLRQCLNSLIKQVTAIVYVDSGSTDSSVKMAESLGVLVVSLDMTVPFTAARARNAGAAKLLKIYPDLQFIQFIDGDCELRSGWIQAAASFLGEHPDYAVVCGRRRERNPQNSIYNLLCDMEWDTPIGDASACGGDALIRTSAYQIVNGYRDDLIAGEEPEMCLRMREKGWKINRIDAEMTLHDAAMTRFGQWWKRAQRAGYAYAEGFSIHGRSLEKYRQKEIRSILVWAVCLPLSFLCLALISPWMLVLFLLYPVQVIRLSVRYRLRITSAKQAFWYALSNVGGKFPQLTGIWRYVLNRIKGRRGTLIEYK